MYLYAYIVHICYEMAVYSISDMDWMWNILHGIARLNTLVLRSCCFVSVLDHPDCHGDSIQNRLRKETDTSGQIYETFSRLDELMWFDCLESQTEETGGNELSSEHQPPFLCFLATDEDVMWLAELQLPCLPWNNARCPQTLSQNELFLLQLLCQGSVARMWRKLKQMGHSTWRLWPAQQKWGDRAEGISPLVAHILCLSIHQNAIRQHDKLLHLWPEPLSCGAFPTMWITWTVSQLKPFSPQPLLSNMSQWEEKLPSQQPYQVSWRGPLTQALKCSCHSSEYIPGTRGVTQCAFLACARPGLNLQRQWNR